MNTFVILIVSLLGAATAIPESKVDDFYQALDERSWCGNTLMGVAIRFQQDIPDAEKPEVLAEIIERAAKNGKVLILERAIAFAGGNYIGTLTLSDHLESALLTQAGNRYPEVRSTLVETLIAGKNAKWRELILSFLKDPDDNVRDTVLRRIYNNAEWPDALSIYKTYLANTPSGSAHKQSLTTARLFSNPEDMHRCDLLNQMLASSNAESVYQSYARQHANDPEYEFSVHEAIQLIDMIREREKALENQREEKEREDELHRDAQDWQQAESSVGNASFENIDHLFWLFDTNDPSTCQYVERYFDGRIPAADQSRVLTLIAERAVGSPANNNVLLNVLIIAEFQPGQIRHGKIWSKKLESIVRKQSASIDPMVRSYAARDLKGWGEE